MRVNIKRCGGGDKRMMKLEMILLLVSPRREKENDKKFIRSTLHEGKTIAVILRYLMTLFYLDLHYCEDF